MSEVSILVLEDFTNSVYIDNYTDNAKKNTLNYRWYPDVNSVYTWQSLETNIDTYFRLYSSNIQTYNTFIRIFDGVQYGLVRVHDDVKLTLSNSTSQYNSKIVENGSLHQNETLIMAVGMAGVLTTLPSQPFTLTADTSGVWLSPPRPPISNICFPAGTPITTNQGTFPIEKINQAIHTIRNKKIVGITQTVTQDKYLVCFEKDSLGINLPSQKTIISKNHGIFYKGKMIHAKEFIGKFENVKKIKYTGEILYNVLMEEHDKMMINNLICETLHPENGTAKLYKCLQNLNPKEQQNLIENCNEYTIKNKVFSSKK